MSTKLEYRARERQRKTESGRQASEAQRENLELEIKNRFRHFLLEEQLENFVAAVTK